MSAQFISGKFSMPFSGANTSAAARAGLPVVIVRPGQIYGHDHPQQPLFLGRVHKRVGDSSMVVVSGPSYLPPLVYVENAADAVLQAGTAEGIEGRAFNVIDDPDLTQAEYFRAISGLPGCPSRVFFVPVGLFAPVVKVVDLLFRILKRRPWSAAYQLLRSGRSVRYSTEAARAELGWEPRVPLRESLVATVSASR